jgi:transcriptional regulator NrdR family protein
MGDSMKCPKCNSDSKVLSTKNKQIKIIRYRKCLSCGNNFKTIEILQDGWTKEYYKEKYEKLRSAILAISEKISD